MPEGAAGTGHHPVPIPAPDLTAWTRAMCLRGISLDPRTSRVLGALESLGSKRCSVNPERFIPKLGGRGWGGTISTFSLLHGLASPRGVTCCLDS